MEDPSIKLSEANRLYQIVDATHDQLLSKNELDIEDIDIDRLHSRGAAISIRMYNETGDKQHLEEAFSRMEKLFSLDLFSNLIRTRLRNSTDNENDIYRQKLHLLEEIDLLTRKKDENSFDQNRLDSLNKAYIEVVETLGTSYKDRKNENLISLPDLQIEQEILASQNYL